MVFKAEVKVGGFCSPAGKAGQGASVSSLRQLLPRQLKNSRRWIKDILHCLSLHMGNNFDRHQCLHVYAWLLWRWFPHTKSSPRCRTVAPRCPVELLPHVNIYNEISADMTPVVFKISLAVIDSCILQQFSHHDRAILPISQT